MAEDHTEKALEGKLVKSFEVKELGELASEYAELGLDSILDEGIVKDIPILRTLVGLAKVGFNIRDRLYLKKIVVFLAQVGQTTQEQRDDFVRKYCGDSKRFEETVMLILEQADREEKAELIGKIFKACILGKIRYEDAITLSEMVNKAFWSDLQVMFDYRDSKEQHQRLFMSGLFEMKGKQPKSIKDDAFEFRRNDYGYALSMIYGENYDELKRCVLGIRAEDI